MKVKAKKVLVKSHVLQRDVIRIRFDKGGKVFEAPLFFQPSKDDIELKDLEVVEIHAESNDELLLKVLAFYKWNVEKFDSTTVDIILSWQYQNGFTNSKSLDAFCA
jgi:hypothetical protein